MSETAPLGQVDVFTVKIRLFEQHGIDFASDIADVRQLKMNG